MQNKLPPLSAQVILTLASLAVAVRNTTQAATNNGDHIITVPAVPKTDTAPAQPEKQVSTGQLPTASGAANTLAVNLLYHLKHIAAPEIAQKAIAVLNDNKLQIADVLKSLVESFPATATPPTPAPAPAPAK